MRPSTVAIISEHEIVRCGLASLLEHQDDVVVVHVEPSAAGQALPTALAAVDVVFYDVARLGSAREEAARLVACGASVVGLGYDARPELDRAAHAAGIEHVLLLSASADQLVAVARGAAEGRLPEVLRAADVARRQRFRGRLVEHGMSDREAEVFELAAAGWTNQQIATALFISANTVKGHLRLAYRRLDLGDRTDAVRWALHHGLDRHHIRDSQPA